MITGELEYLYGKGSNEYEYDYQCNSQRQS